MVRRPATTVYWGFFVASTTHPLSDSLGLLDAIPFRVDPASLGTLLSGPQAFRLLASASETELPFDQFWGRCVPEPQRARLRRMFETVAASGVPEVLEHPMLIQGRPRTVFRTAVQRVGEELVGVMLDVTDARAEQGHARELEAWLVTLGESLPFDFWICDRNGRVGLQNPASHRNHGDRVGESATVMVSEQSLTRALGGTTVLEEVEAGARIYSRVIAPVREHGGEVNGALAVDIDITGLKAVEQQLRVSLTELEAAQEELVRGRSVAALAEMAATVAHEVRNPLTAMFNVTELLRRGDGAHDQGHLLNILFEELNRLEMLVSNIVEMVRPLKAELASQPVAAVLEDALTDALRLDLGEARIQVQKRFEDPRVEVTADGRLLGVALINVLRNALQAMPEGGSLGVEVKSESREGGPPWVTIAIQDTGCGMSPEIQQRMFEPFFTTRASGSGLGLAIVKRVIGEHRGELEVHSEPGRGTAFVMRLPCAPERRS